MARDTRWKQVALALVLTGCGAPPTPGDPGTPGGSGGGSGGGSPPPPIELGADHSLDWLDSHPAFNESFDGAELDATRWRVSDNWASGQDFNAGWRAENVRVAGGQLELRLDNENCPGDCFRRPYASGEVTTQRYLGYGRYEVRMKPVPTPGTMTAFAINTGAADLTRTDAVDLAILGRDTRSLRINYITDGQRHDLGVALPFDAAEAAHAYGIEWTRTAIHWYVDGKRIHSETGHRGALPSQPGRVLVNFWPGLPVLTESWMGRFTYPGAPLIARVDSLRYSPASPTELVEDFETTEKAAQWVRTVDKNAKLTVRQSNNQHHQGNWALYLEYTTSNTAPAFVARTFPTPQDWTGARSLNFWFHGTATGDPFRLELRDNGPSADTAERFEYRFQDDFKGWKWVSVPLTAFTRRSDGQPAGAPSDGLTLSGVWGLAFEPLSGTAHRVFLDDLELER